jgi:hypothetical protein
MQPNDYSWNLQGAPWERHRVRIQRPSPLSMEQSRKRVIEMGEAHCRAFPQDIICHPLPPQ